MKLPFKFPHVTITRKLIATAIAMLLCVLVVAVYAIVHKSPRQPTYKATPTTQPATKSTTQKGQPATKPTQSITWWKPTRNTSWQWQLATPPDPTKVLPVSVYDIDLFDTPASTVSALHKQGKKTICYVETGAWENYRSDAPSFPAGVLGKAVPDYPDERYLDIRRMDILGPIMQKRLDLCKQKGFDAVEPDIDDSFLEGAAVTGFPLTEKEQVAYDSYIATQAHARGLSIGLKNGPDAQFVKDILPHVDWALDEQCFEYENCNALLPFIQAGKAVFEVEYNLAASDFCGQANHYNFNAMVKDVDLDAYRVACR